MRKLLLALLLFGAMAITARAATQKSHKNTESQRNHWQTTPFCPDKERCDKAALWWEPDKGGTILLLWKGEVITISIRQGVDEQVITLESNGMTKEKFYLETKGVCSDCPKLKDGSNVTTTHMNEVAPSQGKQIIHAEWVQTALNKLPEKDERITRLLIKKEAVAGGPQ